MICPKCNVNGLRKQVNIIIDCPADWRAYHKGALQVNGIDIMGIDENYLMMYCPRCGWSKETHDLQATLKSDETT